MGCGCFGWCLVVCCWAFLVLARVFSSYSEFIQGDLCLSAHTAPVPVPKKKGSQFQSERPVTVIQSSQNEVVNQFLAGTSACDDIDQEVARFRSLFGGNTVDVKVCEGIADELTGHPISDRTGGRWSPNRDDTARRIAGGGHPCGESREEHCHRVWCSDLDFSLSVDTEEPC